MLRRFLTLTLVFAGGCANCGENKEEPDPAAYGKPEPPVIVHPKLPDGGRGKAKIIDLSERKPLFDAGEPDPAP